MTRRYQPRCQGLLQYHLALNSRESSSPGSERTARTPWGRGCDGITPAATSVYCTVCMRSNFIDLPRTQSVLHPCIKMRTQACTRIQIVCSRSRLHRDQCRIRELFAYSFRVRRKQDDCVGKISFRSPLDGKQNLCMGCYKTNMDCFSSFQNASEK